MEKKTKVAIFDLRMSDAWDEDFCLVRHSLDYSKSMDDILYFDEKGFPVFQDGPKWAAEAFYYRYCEEHNLELVPYDELEREELQTAEWKIGSFGDDVQSLYPMFYCSHCKQPSYFSRSNYCPNCGAKMKNPLRSAKEVDDDR